MYGGLFRRLRYTWPLAVVAAMVMALTPTTAHAWEVRITITGAGQVTETTPANLVGSGCVTAANNPTGVVGASCSPGDPNGDYGHAWTVRYVATAKPGYRFVHWTTDGSPGPVVCDGANGSHTYTGSACQFGTFSNLQTRAVFVDDTAPTISSINGPSQVVSGAVSFNFSASADPTLSGFECRVANVHDWTTCTSGRSENPATSGTYTFEVRAVDTSGNRSAASTWPWTVDKTPPLVVVNSPANNSYDLDGSFSVGGTTEDGGTVTLAEKPSLTQVGTTVAPNGNWSIPLSGVSNGTHTYAVKAADSHGNESSYTGDLTVIVDTVKPTVASVAPAAAATNVARGANVVASFSEPMRASTVKIATVKLTRKGTTTPISATVTYDPVARRAVLDPAARLAGRATYNAKVTTGVKDVAGQPLAAARAWSFTTRP